MVFRRIFFRVGHVRFFLRPFVVSRVHIVNDHSRQHRHDPSFVRSQGSPSKLVEVSLKALSTPPARRTSRAKPWCVPKRSPPSKVDDRTIEQTLRRVVPRSTNSPRRDAPEKGQRRVLANARESEHPALHPVPCRRRRPVRSSHAARRSRSAKTRSRGHSLLRGKYFAFPFLWLEFGTRVSIVFPNAARRFRFSLPDFRSRNVSDVLTTSVLFPRRHITSFRTQTVTPR